MNSRSSIFCRKLLVTAVLAGLAGPAVAQSVPTSSDNTAAQTGDNDSSRTGTSDSNTQQLEGITVTGIRYSLAQSALIKRTSHGVVDGIVAEDIGKFPDSNLAESLQRISGVSIDRSAIGEGAKVTVRGIGPDYNLV